MGGGCRGEGHFLPYVITYLNLCNKNEWSYNYINENYNDFNYLNKNMADIFYQFTLGLKYPILPD